MKRRAFKEHTYWGRPVPGFGDRSARLVIVGLAPAAHGANRTGRVFTGDRSGDFLFATLHRSGRANQPTSASADDGLVLKDTYIFSVVRCAPPANKPAREELMACNRFTRREMDLLNGKEVVLCLGKIAWDAISDFYKDQGLLSARPKFAHGAEVRIPAGPTLVASYHPSQQNTQTGRLTSAMFDAVLTRCNTLVAETS